MRDFYRFGCDKWGLDITQPQAESPPSAPPLIAASEADVWASAPLVPGSLADVWAEEGGQRDALLARWKAGNTGMPLVDANMRELQATGYLSQRGRQVEEPRLETPPTPPRPTPYTHVRMLYI